MLDPATPDNYSGYVKIDGMGLGVGDFTIDSTRSNSPLPKGFALSFLIGSSISVSGTNNFIITLNSSITDTLSRKISGGVLLTCTYNRVNVLPANLSTPLFPIVIVK